MGLNPTRTGLLEILRSMGAEIEIENARASGAEPVGDLRVRASALVGVAVPASLVPLAIDEFPVLFIAAACARGETVITGAQELRVKESDRLAAMSAGLAALGVEHSVTPDGMRIEGRAGGPAFGGGVIDSQGDHRVAMAFSIASFGAPPSPSWFATSPTWRLRFRGSSNWRAPPASILPNRPHKGSP